MSRSQIALWTSLALAATAALGCGGGNLPGPTGSVYAYANEAGNGTIFVVPASGGAPNVLIAGQAPHNIGGVFAFDGATVYYTDNVNWFSSDSSAPPSTSLLSLPIAGAGTPTTLWSGSDAINGVAVDSESVYFIEQSSSDYTQQALVKEPIGGGFPEVLVASLPAPAYTLAVGGGYAAWADNGGAVYRVATSGGAVEPLASNQGRMAAIAADDSGIYWSDLGQESVDCGASGGSVVGVPAGAPEPITLASGLDNVNAVAVSMGVVYFTFAGVVGCDTFQGMQGQVAQVAAGASLPLATGLQSPSNLFLTPQTVYYTTVTDLQNFVLAPHAAALTP